MSKDEFENDMENRYQEALNDEGIEAEQFFNDFHKRTMKR